MNSAYGREDGAANLLSMGRRILEAAVACQEHHGTEAIPSVLEAVCPKAGWCRLNILAATVELALEIAREGREGRPVGALFTLGGADAVLRLARPLILDPLAGHVPAATHITDPRLRGTIKQLAQLDGAFVIAENGVVVAASRYLDTSAKDVDVPLGLGSRHLAAASVSKELGIIAVVVSQTGIVRVFFGGELMAEIESM